jgi:zinc transport system ATP-binding protein
MSNLLSLHNIHYQVKGRSILQDVSLAVNEGQIVTLIGPSGAGKTTLVRIALGLIAPTQGHCHRQPKLRIGYVPQKVSVNQLMPLTVERFLSTSNCQRKMLHDICEQVSIQHLIHQRLNNLSGGEMQRVLLAKALLVSPQLLVLDEPVQGVDVTGQAELYQLIQDISKRLHCAVLMVSHDLHLVMSATDTVVCMNNHVCCHGHPESVSAHPAYLELFGKSIEPSLALYTHHHNHVHDGCSHDLPIVDEEKNT